MFTSANFILLAPRATYHSLHCQHCTVFHKRFFQCNQCDDSGKSQEAQLKRADRRDSALGSCQRCTVFHMIL